MRLNSIHTKILIGTIGTVTGIGIVLMVLVHAVVQQKLQGALEKRGVFMVHELASEAVTPILTERSFELEMLIRDLKGSDSDVEYYFVVNRRGEVVAHTFDQGFPADLAGFGHVLVYRAELLETERGALINFSAPIMGGQLGTVHLGMSTRFIQQDLQDVRKVFLVILAVFLAIGVAAAIILARTMTKPLSDLVAAAKAVGKGDLDHRIASRSSDEIGDLAISFQEMIEKRKLVEEEREALISQLRDALDNIKTLKGLLPICASCKKIRDDSGYWKKIESYISEHSDAEFTHGLCPDCSAKLYPQFFKNDLP